MERIKYDPSEFTMEFVESRFGPAPVFHTPITPRENFGALFKGKQPLWMPLTTDSQTFCTRVDPDNIARAFVFDGETPYDRAKYGGNDMFGIEWVFVPVVGGSMENPDHPHPMEDANDWREVIKFPDVNAWDWEGRAHAAPSPTACARTPSSWPASIRSPARCSTPEPRETIFAKALMEPPSKDGGSFLPPENVRDWPFRMNSTKNIGEKPEGTWDVDTNRAAGEATVLIFPGG